MIPPTECLELDEARIDPAWALRIPASLALRRRVLPFALVGDKLYVACLDPLDRATFDAIKRFTGRETVPIVAGDPVALQRTLSRVYGDGSARTAESQTKEGGEGSDDAVALVEELMRAAVLRNASDIHLDPSREDVRVRLRVDGVLEEYRRLPLSHHAAVCSRIKVKAGMDIAERRAPQDGAFVHFHGNRKNDVRVASLPTKHGERVTLRLLAGSEERLTLEDLGMRPEDLATLEWTISQPYGLVLLTGPTGSGKSTTLHAAVRRLAASAPLNIISVEDPIEYEIDEVAQVEIDSADKISFGKVLRSLLRQDPDVLVIGEIRDHDSLDIAIKASLTGHLVFSTLHTNNAVSVVTRLVDMETPRHLIAATLKLCVAQRLVRRLCQRCRRPVPLDGALAGLLGRPDLAGTTVYEANGCIYCAGRGYSGRCGLFEFAAIDPATASLIAGGSDEAAIHASLAEKNFRTLLHDGLDKIRAGTTTVAEVLKATTDH